MSRWSSRRLTRLVEGVDTLHYACTLGCHVLFTACLECDAVRGPQSRARHSEGCASNPYGY